MGIDYVLFDRLVELSTRFKPEGRSLMLGGQKFPIQTRYRQLYEKSLNDHGIEARRFDFLQDDGYAETRWNGAANAGKTRPDGETQAPMDARS